MCVFIMELSLELKLELRECPQELCHWALYVHGIFGTLSGGGSGGRVVQFVPCVALLLSPKQDRNREGKKVKNVETNENQIQSQIPNVGEVRTPWPRHADRWALTGLADPTLSHTNLEPKRAA